jgi:hypothetical protein
MFLPIHVRDPAPNYATTPLAKPLMRGVGLVTHRKHHALSEVAFDLWFEPAFRPVNMGIRPVDSFVVMQHPGI